MIIAFKIRRKEQKNQPLGHCARILSFNVETLVAAGKLLGPISDPSLNRNLISNWSCTPAMINDFKRAQTKTPQYIGGFATSNKYTEFKFNAF